MALYPPGAPLPPPPLKKGKFFIYCAILMKFEAGHFHTLIIIEMQIYKYGPPYPFGGPISPPPLKKVKFVIYWMILMKFDT